VLKLAEEGSISYTQCC